MSEQTYSPETDIFDELLPEDEFQETEKYKADKRDSERRRAFLRERNLEYNEEMAREGFRIIKDYNLEEVALACDMTYKEIAEHFELPEDKARNVRRALKWYVATGKPFDF